MYNETLKSFVDTGKIVSYAWAGATNWIGSEEGPRDHWKITVRRFYGSDIEGLRRELQTALDSTFFRFIDEATGINVDDIPNGAVDIRYTAGPDLFDVSFFAPDGRLIAGQGFRVRADAYEEARKLAIANNLPLIDNIVSPQTITMPADLKGGAE